MTTIKDLVSSAHSLYLFNSGIPQYTLTTKSGMEYSSYDLSDLIPFNFISNWKGIRIARLYHTGDPVIQVLRNNNTSKNYHISIEKFLNLDEK